MSDEKENLQLFEFISEFKVLLLEFNRLKTLIIGSKDIDSESEGLRDRLVKLEKRVKSPDELKEYISKLITNEVEEILEIKRKEILTSVWKISGAIGTIITFVITVIIPFINTVTHPTPP